MIRHASSLVLVALVLAGAPALAAPVYNELASTPPCFEPSGGAYPLWLIPPRPSDFYYQTSDWDASTGTLYLEARNGIAQTAWWEPLNWLRSNAWGQLGFGGFDVVRNGSYRFRVLYQAPGLYGAYVPWPPGTWGGADASYNVQMTLKLQRYECIPYIGCAWMDRGSYTVELGNNLIHYGTDLHRQLPPGNVSSLVFDGYNLQAGFPYRVFVEIWCSVKSQATYMSGGAYAAAMFKPMSSFPFAGGTYTQDGRFKILSVTLYDNNPDLTAPTTVIASGSPGGTYPGPVACTLSASDGSGHGVDSLYYQLGNGAWQYYSSGPPAGPIAIDQNTTLRYYAVDHDGNRETTREQTYVIAPMAAVSTALPAVADGGLDWGDYDGDGDLDVLITGQSGSGPISKIYRNEGGGAFADAGAGLTGVSRGSASWGDYDGDGDLDVLLAGHTGSTALSVVYRNDAGAFQDIGAGLIGVCDGAALWADCDNDGDLDILLTGTTGVAYVSRVYRNNHDGTFADAGANLPGAWRGDAAWGDYDADGDLDLVLTGIGGSAESRIYRNNGSGAFTDAGAGLPNMDEGTADWGDCDNDGDLDLLLTGRSSPGGSGQARLFRNAGGGVLQAGPSLSGVIRGSTAWADFDNDGDADIVVAGVGPDTLTCGTRLYWNDGGGNFTLFNGAFPGAGSAAVAWGDFDGDGDLDLLQSGTPDFVTPATHLHRNDGSRANEAPSAPGGLAAQQAGDRVIFTWTAATDDRTAAGALTYNLRVGTTPGTSDVMSAMAVPSTGLRHVAAPGNTQQRRSWSVRLPAGGRLYWSVQAVDGAFAGSAFAPERIFESVNFADAGVGLPPLMFGSAAWGDCDGDGDLDLAMIGRDAGSYLATSRVYRNNGSGAFTDAGAGLTGVYNGALAWGDYDGDGDLDLVLTGNTGSSFVTRLYRNGGSGSFTDAGAGFPGVAASATAWGDYDNDGDLDLLLAGDTGAGGITRLYRNDHGAFSEAAATGLPATAAGSAAWGDCDNDGDLDVLITGSSQGGALARVYLNAGDGTFFTAGDIMPGVNRSEATWGDYDADGDLDILMTGNSGSGFVARIYRSDLHLGPGHFEDLGAPFIQVGWSRAAWGDYDNDGDLDVVLAGDTNIWPDPGDVTRIYRNDGGATFTDIGAGLPGMEQGSVTWADADGDGDLDMLVTGNSGFGSVSSLFRGAGAPPNTPPATPTGLFTSRSGAQMTFGWAIATDAQTPAAGLSYNLRVGTTPGGNEMVASMSSAASGFRRVTRVGNAQKRTTWTVQLPPGPTYYWSVQAVDGAFAGSPFAAERTPPALQFTDILAGLPGGIGDQLAWGDYDRDGDLDLVIAMGSEGPGETKLYRNDGGGYFSETGTLLPGLYSSCLAWGDCDNDGDLDLALTGNTGAGLVARIYRNEGSDNFYDIGAGLVGVESGSLAWGDCDNDGDLDLALAGLPEGGAPPIARVYRNGGDGSFLDAGAALAGVANGTVGWADYDNDADLDLLLAGTTAGDQRMAEVYRNDGSGAFTAAGASLLGVDAASSAWGDYDNDGDLDLLLSGWRATGSDSSLYRNDGVAGFTPVISGMPRLPWGSAAWGDCDNDGDLDALVTGALSGSGHAGRVYVNNGNDDFHDIALDMPGERPLWAEWGDYDNDGDLDIAELGWFSDGSTIWRNTGATANTPPTAPGGLSAFVAGDRVTLSWSAATDAETPAAGLSYNLRVGTTPLGNEVVCAHADSVTGWRRVAQTGNAQQRLSWTLNLPPGAGTYYWSVQAVDAAHAGSPFAAERTFRVVAFTDLQAGLTGLRHSSTAWGDFDDDCDLDLLVSGEPPAGPPVTRLYRNDGAGAFTEAVAGLPGVAYGSVAWGDYDNDGKLDILLNGCSAAESCAVIARVYRNQGSGVFSQAAELAGGWDGVATWGDCDNDGDLDALVSGGLQMTLYRNDGAAFTALATGLPGLTDCSAEWGDYDADGDLDLVLVGATGTSWVTRVCRNDGASAFKALDAGLPGLRSGSAAWGDGDGDGDLDLALSGVSEAQPITRVYRNDGAGAFTDVAAGLPGVSAGSLAWGDYDNDGDLDLALAGTPDTTRLARVYRNDGGWAFTDIGVALPGLSPASLAWGDCDDDGDLDLAMTGDAGGQLLTRVYRNEGAAANTPPSAPAGLSAAPMGNQVTLSWLASADAQTPAAALSYNLRVGTTPGGNEILSAMAGAEDGCRRVVQPGNAQHRLSWTLRLKRAGQHYWSVQALDGAYAASAFAPEQEFTSTLDAAGTLPRELSFSLATANPVAGVAAFRLGLPAGASVEVSIFDLAGRRVATLAKGDLPAGYHTLTWPGNRPGSARPAGVYFARFTTNGRALTRRVVVID